MLQGFGRYAGCALIVLALVGYSHVVRDSAASVYAPQVDTSVTPPDAEDAGRVEAFRKASESEKKQNYSEAVTALRTLPRSAQDSFWNVRMAWLYQTLKDYRNAQKHFEMASRQDSNSFEPKTGLLLAMISQERYSDVEKTARQVFLHDPENYYANLRLAYVLRLQLKLPQAIRINQKMLALHPADSSFLIEQALACAAQKRYDEARPYYQKVLLVAPDNAIANQALSIAQGTRARDFVSEGFRKAYNLENEGKYTEAIASLANVKTNKTYEYFVNLRLGWLNYLAGQQVESQNRYESAVKLAPRAVEPLVGLLLPLLAQEKFTDAEQIARQAVQLDSLNYFARLRLGYALRKQQKFAEAEKSNDLLLRRYPGDVTMLLEQALTLEGLHRPDEALRLFRRVQLLAPENPIALKALKRTNPVKPVP